MDHSAFFYALIIEPKCLLCILCRYKIKLHQTSDSQRHWFVKGSHTHNSRKEITTTNQKQSHHTCCALHQMKETLQNRHLSRLGCVLPVTAQCQSRLQVPQCQILLYPNSPNGSLCNTAHCSFVSLREFCSIPFVLLH